jgi:hypothetical protein
MNDRKTLAADRIAALEALAARDGGLTPQSVVAAAEPEDSPLHGLFEWDDSVAGPLYREQQAKSYIRAVAIVLPDPNGGEPMRVRAFVSLPRDRGEGGAGYRRTTEVMEHEEMRRELLSSAIAEYKSYRTKYRYLQAMADFFRAGDAEIERLDAA